MYNKCGDYWLSLRPYQILEDFSGENEIISPTMEQADIKLLEASWGKEGLPRILSLRSPSLARANINIARSVYAFTSLRHDS